MMKTSLSKLMLLVAALFSLNFNLSSANAQVKITTDTEESLENIQDIFSEDYDREVTEYVDSIIANRVIAELDEYFSWDLSAEDIQDGAIVEVLLPSFTEEDGNEIRIIIENNADDSIQSLVDLQITRKWKSEDEYKEFYTVFTKILDSELEISEIENSFSQYLKSSEDFSLGEVEYYISSNDLDDKEDLVVTRRFNGATVPQEEASEVGSVGAEFNPDDYPYITDYESVVRDPDGMSGEKINIYGEVIQIMEDSGITILRVATTGGYDDIYLVYMITPDVRVIEDDIVDIYGTALGLETYEAVLGNSVTIPSIYATEVWVKGLDF